MATDSYITDASVVAMAQKIIRVENVSFRYQSQTSNLFSGLNLGISEGSLIALLGRSGCGKTTLLNILSGYLRPSKGTCYLRASKITEPSPSRIPIYQEDSLWPWLCVVKNVTLYALLTQGAKAARSREKEACELLGRVGLHAETHGKYPKELSAGMKKRVEIARALFAMPEVILADEPFGSLDPETRADLHQLVQSIWKERHITILFSTHDVDEAIYLATKVVVLQMDSSTTRVGAIFENPLRGRRELQRDDPKTYFSFYDKLRTAMRGGRYA